MCTFQQLTEPFFMEHAQQIHWGNSRVDAELNFLPDKTSYPGSFRQDQCSSSDTHNASLEEREQIVALGSSKSLKSW